MDGGATTESLEAGGWWTTTLLWTIVLFGSFLLNATLLFAFLKRPGLRTISNRFVMNLIASNLATCVFLTPLLMLDAAPSSFGSSLCAISEGATALVTASSILSVLLIAIDQYLAVVDPLRYRTRIDKLKCAVLIISVWLVSILVALLAAFNPQPRSLWLSCRGDARRPAADRLYDYDRNLNGNATLDLTLDSTFLFGNGTEDYNLKGQLKVTERNGSSTIEEDLEFAENSSSLSRRTILERNYSDVELGLLPLPLPLHLPLPLPLPHRRTDLDGVCKFCAAYGLAYVAFYTLFVYLVPFLGVCWIYVSIYLAAHKNSERARRTGSGPMLSSPSFCEEHGATAVRREFSSEDFRRIPKISSLSSIEESIETGSCQIPRRKSEMTLSSSPIEEEPSTGVVFTVGSQKVDVSPQKPARSAKDTSKVPTSALRAEFLSKRGTDPPACDDRVRSRFRDRPDQRRKSSHDVMCEGRERFQIQYDSSDESSADEEAMLTFAKNRRLRDIEVAKCQNSIEDSGSSGAPLLDVAVVRSDGRPSASSVKQPSSFNAVDPEAAAPDGPVAVVRSRPLKATTADKVQISGSGKATGAGSGILSRAALENHNARSKVLGKTNRHSNGGCDRSELPDEAFPKNFPDAESSLLGTSSGGGAPTVTITPPHKIPLHRVSSIKSTSSYINSLKYRISNGSLFKYREETRAARISALVIVMGLICWTPYVVVTLMRNLPLGFTGENDLPHRYDVMAVSFLILAAYVSPLLFGYRSRRVKRELRKIFCFKKELSYKNNRSLMAKKVLKRRHSSNLSQIEMDSKYNIFSCVYGRNRWPKEKVQFMQVPETALAVETCRSSFSSGASTQISTTSTEE